MNNRALTLSLVAAALALFFSYSYVTSIEEEGKKKFGTEVLVVTARQDIKEMEDVKLTMLELKLIPKTFLEPSAVWLVDKVSDAKKNEILRAQEGLIAAVPIKKGEQLTYNKVTSAGLKTGLSFQVTPGRRAVAIRVSEDSAVSKLVKPGDRVDLIAILDMGGGKENKFAKTILQDVIVLSVGHNITNNAPRTIESDPAGGRDRVRTLADDFSYGTVTLEVEPAQAQSLALIMASGENAMTISLRNNDDVERVNLPIVGMGEVAGPESARFRGGARR